MNFSDMHNESRKKSKDKVKRTVYSQCHLHRSPKTYSNLRKFTVDDIKNQTF